jgi:hypothetical protein
MVPEPLSILYPSKPGFIMLCHSLKKIFRTFFNLESSADLNTDDSFAVRMFEQTIYHSPEPQNPDQIDIAQVVANLARITPPTRRVHLDELEKQTEPPEIENEWKHSFCSGE